MLLAAVTRAAPPDGGVPSSPLTVTEMRCEYLRDPLGIDTPLPQFGWRLVDPNQTRGQRQTAWQLVVEGSATGTPALLWDSGKVASDESVHVTYGGSPLRSNMDCRWKARVWDKDGRASAWSPSARFSIGLLDPADWTGAWIRHAGAGEADHLWYRKSFTLDRVPPRAFAYLASVGYHELYVNGKKIGTRVLSPSVSNLAKRVLYVTYDITSELRQGDNVIAVWTGPGWARSDGSYGKGVWKQDSVFKCQVQMADGPALHTDASWKCKVSLSRNLGLWKGGGQGEYGGELIDARLDLPDWNQPALDDRDWADATSYQNALALTAEMIEPDRKVATLKPVSLNEKGGRTTYDMGRNFTGWLEFKLRNGKAGQVVKFTTANRPEVTVEFDQESRYIHEASGTGTFSHRFNYMAGRWITVEGLDYQPTLDDLRCYMITNDRARTGSFACSNELFNQIYETDLRTYLACTVNGVTMDCPHRERFGYGEVALACAWGCAIPNFESAAFCRKVIRDWFDVQREDGFVNTIAPQVYKGAGGALWSSAPVTLGWEFHKAYGDRRMLAESYQSMKKWLDFLHQSVSADGVLTAYESPSRFLGDWATPHGSEYGNTPPAQLFNNGVYALCLDAFVRAAEILGHTGEVEVYSARLADLRRHAHRYFFNPETKTYLDGRQLALAFPLLTGITPEKERPAVFANFVGEIGTRKPYLDTGSSGLPILLAFIVDKAERPDLLFPCLARTEQPGYGYFLKSGETTWPEYWKIKDEPSRIHTCYTGIAGYFIKAVGGIRPDPSAWGMKKFLIKPNLVGNLAHANTSSASLYGPIVSNWRRSGTTAVFDIEVPVNTTAKIFIPAARPEDVREGGGPAAAAPGVTSLGMQGANAVFEIGSGVYQFSSSPQPPP